MFGVKEVELVSNDAGAVIALAGINALVDAIGVMDVLDTSCMLGPLGIFLRSALTLSD